MQSQQPPLTSGNQQLANKNGQNTQHSASQPLFSNFQASQPHQPQPIFQNQELAHPHMLPQEPVHLSQRHPVLEQQKSNINTPSTQTSYSQPYIYSQPPQYYVPYGLYSAGLQVYPQQASFYLPHSQSVHQFTHTMAQYHPTPYVMPLIGSQYYASQQYPPQIMPFQQPQTQPEIQKNLQVECTPGFSMRTTQEFSTPKLLTVSTSLDQSNTTLEAQTSLRQIESSAQCRVVLQVECYTNLNQRVAVVGSVPALGSWQVSKSLLMSTEQNTYPKWTGQFSADETVPTIEFKFVKLTSQFDRQIEVEWEDIQTNRVIDVSNRASIVVEYGFGQQEKRKETFVNRVQNLIQEPINLELYNQSRSSPLLHARYNVTPNTQQADRSPLEDFSMLSKTQDIRVKDFTESSFLGGKSQPNLSVDSQNQDHFCDDHYEQKYSCRHCSRKLLKQELDNAFPQNVNNRQKEKLEKIKAKRRGEGESDSTSNASNPLDGCHVQNRGGSHKSNILIAKNINTKKVQLEPKECIVQVSHQLPYQLISKGEGQFSVVTSYPSPSLLYANLDDLMQIKTYNFVWVGIVVMNKQMTSYEEDQASKILREKNCFPIFLTHEQIIPYLSFYEQVIRPNMHNFTDPSDHLKLAFNYWNEFKSINAKIAKRVQDVRQLVNSHTIWIHGDQNMLVPYYIRQSEKVKSNIGFYFHQAFPASAVFQSFYKREELLQSLLHSDLIGFHIWEYARNFINSCQRLLGLYYELGVGNTLSVFYNKRSIQIRIQHIGLDESFVEKIMAGQKYQVARLKVTNTVRNAVAREQIIRASVSRGNLNSLQNNTHSASLPALIGPGLNSTRKTNSASITSTLASSGFSNESYVDTTQGKIIFASIDSFHHLTGLILKLKGYYNFLKNFPEYRDKVVLFQVIRGLFAKSENMKGQHKEETKQKKGQATNSDKQGTFWLFEEVESLQTLNQSVIKMVNKIRGEFGRSCLIVQQGNWSVDMRLALWSKANVLFVSTLKDGLYLTCFEYIHVKHLCNDFKNSAMILSEFTGCSTQFAGFYDFNPFQLQTTVAALEKCLKDSPEERAERMKRAFQFCRQRTFSAWTDNFLKELKLACDPHTVEFTRIMYQGLQAVQYGKASKYVDHQLSVNAPLLPVQMDIKKQAMLSVSTRKNLIMIDHEALPLKQLGRSEMCPRNQIILWIQEILYDKNNVVIILSDKDRSYISSVFEQTLMQQENFWVAAESGYWLMTNKKQWTELFGIQSKQWMHTIRKIMEEYCDNIDGTVVEERSCTVVWNYKNAEEEHGSKSANILAQQIQHMLGQSSPIQIVRGNGFIEVLPKKLTKKAVFKHIFSNLKLYCKNQIESFLFIGAGITDDSHQYLRDQILKNNHESTSHTSFVNDSRNRPLFAADCQYALCVLGNRPSIAQFYLEQRDVQYLLQEMAFKTQSRKRTKSVANLLKKSKNVYSSDNLDGSRDKIDQTQQIDTKDLQSPQKKNLVKGRHLSQKNLLRTINIPARWTSAGIGDQVENETIFETNEEDDMTQMSEIKQPELDNGISIDFCCLKCKMFRGCCQGQNSCMITFLDASPRKSVKDTNLNQLINVLLKRNSAIADNCRNTQQNKLICKFTKARNAFVNAEDEEDQFEAQVQLLNKRFQEEENQFNIGTLNFQTSCPLLNRNQQDSLAATKLPQFEFQPN